MYVYIYVCIYVCMYVGEEHRQYGPLVMTHYNGEFHALCTSSVNEDIYITCGDEGLLCLWSIQKRMCLRSVLLGCACRAISFSNDGKYIILGYGTQNFKDFCKTGGFCIMDSRTLVILFEGRDSKRYITDIKWSMDDKSVALCSEDGAVYFYYINFIEEVTGVSTGENSSKKNEVYLDVILKWKFLQNYYCDTNRYNE